MNIYEQITKSLQQSIDRPSINKFYRYTIEELQDDPDRLSEIADFLTTHKGKYTDFSLITWIDEATFSPVIMLQLQLSEEYAKNLKPGFKEKLVQYFHQAKENQEKN